MTTTRSTGQTTAPTIDAAARTTRRWMLAVGVFYVLIGVRLLPWINGAMIEAIGLDAMYLAGDLTTDAVAFSWVLDWMGTFGLDLLVIGGVLLWASRDPLRHRVLVHLVIWREVVGGVLPDLWLISRDYIANAFYLGFIVVHLVIIATGVRALRRAADVSASTSQDERTAVRAS